MGPMETEEQTALGAVEENGNDPQRGLESTSDEDAREDIQGESDGDSTAASEAGSNLSLLAALPQPIREAVEAKGFAQLTAVQEAVLRPEALGRDLQVSSQTGSGKTLALGLVVAPALFEVSERAPLVLVLAPTRELAQQVRGELEWLFAACEGLEVGVVTGGNPIHRDKMLLRREPAVLVGTPGRVLDHLRTGQLDLSGVRELVLDEADQMLDMGFREDLEAILDATPEGRRTHMVSATFPKGILQLAERYQRNPLSLEGTRRGAANQDIQHRGFLVARGDRYPTLVHLLLEASGGRTLVFVEKRADALSVAERLRQDGFKALPLSGELAQSHRERTLDAFREGKADVLVATDVAARGLDVPDVARVIHTAPPIDAEVYTHRSGRTGRAGNEGVSVLLAPFKARRRVERLLTMAQVRFRWEDAPDGASVRAALERRTEDELIARVDAAMEREPAVAREELARRLLEDREPVRLVATLLGLVLPSGSKPAAAGGGASRAQAGPAADPSGVADLVGRPAGRRDSQGLAEEGFVRFFMNQGGHQGLTPGRLLAAACRRGDVTGDDIGSIAIHPNASTFDVRVEVAERFEVLAGRRDPRDPDVVIRRDRGPAGPPARRRRRRGPDRPQWPV